MGHQPELVGAGFIEPFAVAPLGDAFQRGHDILERLAQLAPVIPEPQAQDDHHRDEDHGGRGGRLHGVVRGFGGPLLDVGDLRFHDRRRGVVTDVLQLVDQLDHRSLGVPRVAPDRNAVSEAHHRDSEKRGGKEPRDTRRAAAGALAGGRRGSGGERGGDRGHESQI